jgi:hypothetical protein
MAANSMKKTPERKAKKGPLSRVRLQKVQPVAQATETPPTPPATPPSWQNAPGFDPLRGYRDRRHEVGMSGGDKEALLVEALEAQIK